MSEEGKKTKIVVQNGTIAGLHFSSEESLNVFIEKLRAVIVDEDIKIWIDSINPEENKIAYQKLIDIIVEEEVASSLSCREFIYLYCMLREGFNASTEERMEKLFKELQIMGLEEEIVGKLSIGNVGIIRSAAAFLQGCKVLVFKHGMRIYSEAEKKVVNRLLRIFLASKGIGLILSTNKRELEELSDVIYYMDANCE